MPPENDAAPVPTMMILTAPGWIGGVRRQLSFRRLHRSSSWDLPAVLHGYPDRFGPRWNYWFHFFSHYSAWLGDGPPALTGVTYL